MASFDLCYLFNKNISKFCVGDFISIIYQLHVNKDINCTFDGVVMKVKNRGIASTITVQKVCTTIKVVCVFFIFSPLIKKITIRSI